MPQAKSKAKLQTKSVTKAHTKVVAGSSSPARGRLVIKLMPAGLPAGQVGEVLVRFGSVEVRDVGFNPKEKQRNIGTGQVALSRAAPSIIKAGFAKRPKDSAPRFRADPGNPQILIRELNGKSEKGVFVAGKFKALTA